MGRNKKSCHLINISQRSDRLLLRRKQQGVFAFCLPVPIFSSKTLLFPLQIPTVEKVSSKLTVFAKINRTNLCLPSHRSLA